MANRMCFTIKFLLSLMLLTALVNEALAEPVQAINIDKNSEETNALPDKSIKISISDTLMLFYLALTALDIVLKRRRNAT